MAQSNSVIHLKKCQTGFQSICTIVSSNQNVFFISLLEILCFYGHLNHIALICIFLMITNIIIITTAHVFVGFCRHTSAQYLFLFFAFLLALIFKSTAHLSAIGTFPSFCLPCLFTSGCLLYNISLLVCLSIFRYIHYLWFLVFQRLHRTD